MITEDELLKYIDDAVDFLLKVKCTKRKLHPFDEEYRIGSYLERYMRRNILDTSNCDYQTWPSFHNEVFDAIKVKWVLIRNFRGLTPRITIREVTQ